MKKTYLILLSIIFGTSIFAQNCTNCTDPPTADNKYRSTVGKNNGANGDYSFAGGENSVAEGARSFAFGYEVLASSSNSFAFGANSSATGVGSFVFGKSSSAESLGTFAIGTRVKARFALAMAIGSGPPQAILQNNLMETMVIGFNSTNPTLFISRSINTSYPYSKTGRVAIGNVVNSNGFMDPQAKLHIRSDYGEQAAIFIEPNNWNAGEAAKIMLGDTNHFIRTSKSIGMEFNSSSNFVFNGNNSGFGVEEPKAKVHINGDLLFEQSLNGIIMKSEDGNCWKGTMSNNGELIFTQVDCETLSSTENITEPKHSEIFIYPNPTNGQITVEYTGNEKNLRLEIKSISGHLIATHKIKKGENSIELENISDQMIVASVFTKKGELISTNKVVIKK